MRGRAEGGRYVFRASWNVTACAFGFVGPGFDVQTLGSAVLCGL